MVDTNRLEHAPGTMPYVQPEQDHAEDVPGRHIPDFKSSNHIVIDVALNEVKARVYNARREMEQVIDYEGEDDGPAPVHSARGIGRGYFLLLCVSYGARLQLAGT